MTFLYLGTPKFVVGNPKIQATPRRRISGVQLIVTRFAHVTAKNILDRTKDTIERTAIQRQQPTSRSQYVPQDQAPE